MKSEAELIDELANRLETETNHEIRTEEHGVIIEGDFEMFGDSDTRHLVDSFFRQQEWVSGWTVGVTTAPGELTGPMIVDEINTVN